MKVGRIVLAALSGLASWTASYHANSPPAELRTAAPIRGAAILPGGKQAKYTYHFDHNALDDAVRVGDALVAITESGNLLRFDAKSLALTTQKIVPGYATAITPGDHNRILVGTSEGRILEVDPIDLSFKQITATNGIIVWLSARESSESGRSKIVAVVDNDPRVLPWPGESDSSYDRRSANIKKRQRVPYFVFVYSDGNKESFPFSLGKYPAFPNAFQLDSAGRLWLGTDRGEWGGELSFMELRTGRIQKIKDGVAGVLGFLKSADGRLLLFGGTSHLGMRSGYIAQIKGIGVERICVFDDQNTAEDVGKDAEKTPICTIANDEDEAKSAENMPESHIDQMIEDADGHGFWIVSAHILYHADAKFSHWTKTANLGGRWQEGRRDSVGNTPTVNRLILDQYCHDGLIAIMGRDGLERVSGERVERFEFSGELGASVIDIWNTSIGALYLDSTDAHAAWRLDGDRWKAFTFYPDRHSTSTYGDWGYAHPFEDDGSGIIAFVTDSTTPGERLFTKLDAQGAIQIKELWKDESSGWSTAVLRTRDGQFLRASDNKLEIRDGSVWRNAGTDASAGPIGRNWTYVGRQYIPLGRAEADEFFLDARYGDFMRLTRKPDRTYDFGPLVYKNGAAPTGVYDSIADGDGWLLIATAHGLFRFRPQDGQHKLVPSPNASEMFKSICRDSENRLWVAGDRLYISSDEGKHWLAVDLPMLTRTYTKKVRPDPMTSRAIVLSAWERGMVFVEW